MDQRSVEKSSGEITRENQLTAERAWTMAEIVNRRETHQLLIVDTRVAALRRTGDLLRRAGHDVLEAGSFDEAKRVLVQRLPALMISSLRLAAFNGLHLVHLARLARPEISAIIVSTSADAVLQSEAERVGASLLVEPVPPTTLLALISQLLEASASLDDQRGIERRQAERRRAGGRDVDMERRISDRRINVGVAHRDSGLT